ncbi:hypothetical protein BJF81_14115 [Ornithinimicrobium sp. CNJ-824]|uniref:O-antigen ligase family protein n=1 Tax=Ornithinimicrobium sp. CNJ-824 TaxID=1904966 RepID=UPI000966E07C|nr:O-antigen ligase family protein [Ornithinimicrobium sp. CNJ-824]OLT21975.1 hypothetical protein BJF81_14115 [Ornithinimicrobium sp. CNJ-824]
MARGRHAPLRDKTLDVSGTGHQAYIPAVWFVCCYVVLLLCIPTRLIVGPIGAPGTPANLFAIVGLIWWTCALLGGLVMRRGPSPTRVLLGLFVVCVLASYASGHFLGWYQPADIHQRSDRRWAAADVVQVTEILSSAADRGVLYIAGWVGIALVTAEGLRSWRELDRVITFIVGAASFVASLGIIQYFTGRNLAAYLQLPGLTALADFGDALSRSDLNRIVSTSAHPIELGVVMSSVLPLALHRSLHARRWLAWVPTLLIAVASLMSVSRSAVVVAAVAMLILFASWPWRWRLRAVMILPVAAVVGRAVLPGLLGTVRSLFTGLEHDPSIEGRTADYELVWRLIAERPLFGQGMSTFVPTVYRTIDNQGLGMLLELGLVGTAVFVLLVLTGVVGAWRPRRLGMPSERAHLGVAISASLSAIITSYVTFDAWAFRHVAGLSFLLIGLAGAVWHLSHDPGLGSPDGPASDDH